MCDGLSPIQHRDSDKRLSTKDSTEWKSLDTKTVQSTRESVTTAGPAANLDHGKIAGLLSETFVMVKRELDSLKDADPEPEMHEDSSPQKEDHKEKLEPSASRGPRQLGDDKTLALRQQYLELLLQAVEKRMDKKL
ncbi:mitogen-activated protein kinase-binding protein 1-like isoform 1-T3 [Anomaloglossus baeobatrachus]|uniref:mitogen-activated protein kinase-binding protein 1-like n=1 Tax=Anomaloglossus baeobatrachus TaxID=238106 RepID=UPI003F506841